MRQCLLAFYPVIRRTVLYNRRTYTLLAQRARKSLESLPVPLTQARPEPFALVSAELTQIRRHLLDLLGSAQPGLQDTAEYFFLRPSVHIRSLLVLLFSRATNGIGQGWHQKAREANCERVSDSATTIDVALRNPDVLHNWHPTMSDTTASFSSVFELQRPICPEQEFSVTPISAMSLPWEPAILPSQIRLGQIMEMIHIASLLHDGVYDVRKPDVKGMGNKMTILGGDFLLGRASAVLPRLGENEVVELVAGIISNMVEGEMLRMEVKTSNLGSVCGPKSISEAWEQYLRKTYLKSASLMAKGARASVVLGGCQDGDMLKEVAYVYGRNLGFAKQLMDDASDYEFGLNNVQLGIATAPALYATDEFPELLPIINRHMSKDGDLECIIDCIRKSSGVERTRDLARTYGNKAKEVLQSLPHNDSVSALETLIVDVLAGTYSG